MALSAAALCARALLKVGATPIRSLDEPVVEAEVARAFYEPVRDQLLSHHPWSFALRQRRLARHAEPPEADFAHSFALPDDFLRALSAGPEGRGRGLDYRIAGRRLETHSGEVMLSYIARAKEEDTPPFFDGALVARLAAEFCLPLTESAARAELLARLADAEFARARLTDSQQDTPPRIEDFSLIGARR